jgi:hypothetical protein
MKSINAEEPQTETKPRRVFGEKDYLERQERLKKEQA